MLMVKQILPIWFMLIKMILSIEPNQSFILEGQDTHFQNIVFNKIILLLNRWKITDVTFKIIKGYNSGGRKRYFYTQVSINLIIKCFHKSKIKQYEISKKITSILWVYQY
jgi:hypothetical protein